MRKLKEENPISSRTRDHRRLRSALRRLGYLPAPCRGTRNANVFWFGVADTRCRARAQIKPKATTTVKFWKFARLKIMESFSFDNIATQFYDAGVHYSTAIQPYALKLFFALFLIDILVTWIQYGAEGQLDPSYFLGRMLKHILSGGFVYLMIINGFNWMYLVIQSFSRIGAAISGLPALSPQSVLQAGLSMASTLLNSPATSAVMSSLEQALVEWFCAAAVGAAFVIVAVELLLTLVKAYLTTGLGVILLGFGGNRFTASAAEGYFTSVIRVGVKLLFFYAVLAIGMQLVAKWETGLAAACKPMTTAVPLITSYYVPPSKIMTTICSGSISSHRYARLRCTCGRVCDGHSSRAEHGVRTCWRHGRTSSRSRLRSCLYRSDYRKNREPNHRWPQEGLRWRCQSRERKGQWRER